jgi:integrase
VIIIIPLNLDKPIRNKLNLHITPEEALLFFKSFTPKELKYKVFFLIALTTGLRIKEVCYIHLNDLSITEDRIALRVNIQKKIKYNEIAERILPKVTSEYLRLWITKNYWYIKSKKGWLFPKPNNRGQIQPPNAPCFLRNKCKLIDKLHNTNLNEIVGWKHYKQPKKMFGKEYDIKHPIHRFSCHSLRRFWITYLPENDPSIIQSIIRHEKINTTLRYKNEAKLRQKEAELVDTLFNANFMKDIMKPTEEVACVWDKLKQYPE